MSLVKSEFKISNLDENQVNLGYFASNLLDYGNNLKEKLKLSERDANRLKTTMKDNFLHIESVFPFCPNCKGTNLKSNGWNKRELIFPDTGKETVKIKKYACLDGCNDGKNKYFKVNIDSIVDSNSNYTKIFKEEVLKLYEVESASLRNTAELMNNRANTSLSHQAVQDWILAENRDKLPKPDRFSGYYGFDIQWVKNYRLWKYRYLLIDTEYNTIVADTVLLDEKSETVEKFLNENLFNKPLVAMVTDLDKTYKPIIEKMGLEHQRCMNHARKALKKRVKKYKSENKTSVLENDLMDYYVKKIMFIYDCEDFNQAKMHLDAIIDEYEYLPKAIQIILSELIVPYFKTFTLFLRDPKVPRTNNQCENIFNKTYPKSVKRQGKTEEGIESRCAIKERRWDKRNANF
jgi:hypothetical protein